MNEQKYNGWTNYETWLVKLWFDNDEASQAYWRQRAGELCDSSCEPAYDLANVIKEELDDRASGHSSVLPGLFQDLLNAAISSVDYHEIAKAYVDEVEEERDEELKEAFEKYFASREEWNLEYVQSDDYASEYAYLMKESDRINESVERLLRLHGATELLAAEVADRILADGLFGFRCVDEYSSESVGYLDSFQVGEYEDQVELSAIVDEVGEFDVEKLRDWIGEQRDFCLKESLDSQWPHMYLITYTGLRIDYFIDEEEFRELVDTIRAEKSEGGAE